MNKPARVNEIMIQDGPSLFTGIALEVDEIILCRNRINTSATDLRAAMTAQQASSVKQAAEEIAKVAGQMNVMAAHIASVIARLQARRPRP